MIKIKDEFDSIDELFDELQNNPAQILVGETIEIECPVCNEETKGKVMNENTIQCSKCGEVMDLIIDLA